MDIEQRVYNLENSVNALRIDTTEIKTGLAYIANQSDLTELKAKFDSTVPHLVTKTWLATVIGAALIAQVFIPEIRVFFNLNNYQTHQVISSQEKSNSK